MQEQSRPAGAVFLSYASEDAEAAARICESLRAAGVEVWFDRSELRGGDAWDSQIKKQIHDCALFVPLISAHTNSRIEGYFRGEWNLATRRLVNRAHDAAFLMPVVVDETREADARVPEEFLWAQWTWLPGGETPPAFARRVRQLLGLDPATVPTAKAAATGAIESSARSGGSLRPRGSSRVRRFALPLIALLLVIGAGLYWYYQGASEDPAATPAPSAELAVTPVPPNDKSIAVLPFADMSAEKNQEYMSDGIAEELLNLLSQAPDLKVIARTSSFAFKGQNIDIAEIAKKLNVAHILEGSVRTSGNKLRVTVQLVRTADSTHLWSERYDRPIDDIFAVQDEIANAVVSELKVRLLGSASKSKGRDPKAYALYLQARDIADQYTALALDQAISLYEQALERDPSYAEAWDGLANIYGNQALDGLRARDEGFRLAAEAAQKALALDPQSALAHARLGWIEIYYDQDLRKAARHFLDALALDSGNTEVVKMTIALLRRIDRLELAVQFGEHVLVHDPVNSDAHFDLGRAHYFAGHWDEAITEFRTALALSPSSLGGHAVIGEALVLQGNAKAALEEIQLENDEGWSLEVKSLAHHALGQSAASEAAWVELAENYGQLFAIATAEAAAFRGDTERAFEWLEKAAELRDPALGQIPFSPLCNNLHKDPRWLPFLRKHGMAPEQLAAIKFDFTLPK